VSVPKVADIPISHLEMNCRSAGVSVCAKGLCIDASMIGISFHIFA
jgi:hypothetical protein